MPDLDDTLAQPTPPRFDSTQWSLVIQAQHRSSAEGKAALSELCQRYWFPLFAYVRYLGNDLHHAQDITQGFFERLIEKNYVGDADPARGKFRTFLLTSLKHFMANEYDKRTAQKRGGSRKHFSLEFDDAEQRFTIEPTSADDPEVAFEQQWARTLLDQVIGQLREVYIQNGKSELFDELKGCLTSNDVASTSESASRLGMTESAIRVAIHRMRKQYRDCLRNEIASTLGDPNDVENEISALFTAFSG